MAEITPERAEDVARAMIECGSWSPAFAIHDEAATILRKFADLLRENEHLQSELHAGHYLVSRSRTTPLPNVRPGWMICVRCKYETPSAGWCVEHGTLDACWAKEMGNEIPR